MIKSHFPHSQVRIPASIAYSISPFASFQPETDLTTSIVDYCLRMLFVITYYLPIYHYFILKSYPFFIFTFIFSIMVSSHLNLMPSSFFLFLLFFLFPVVQFIVVSLKEGMFNNANVLFRTKFVDGVSTVQRTVTKQQNK